ncbi:NADP-malic enzyme [Artemisia annua]|uniref:NADP-malic enzyme n=1 Tax=Artemisia annua TaxID=35608 RepID=A0A2U1LZH5_ARTAN|nr:NADP-malic enzyme [Artemisia annua]
MHYYILRLSSKVLTKILISLHISEYTMLVEGLKVNISSVYNLIFSLSLNVCQGLFSHGFGHGLIISGTLCVRDYMVLAVSEALANQVTQEHLDKGLLYPPFTNIRKNLAKKMSC